MWKWKVMMALYITNPIKKFKQFTLTFLSLSICVFVCIETWTFALLISSFHIYAKENLYFQNKYCKKGATNYAHAKSCWSNNNDKK